jgi:hypothetical protein
MPEGETVTDNPLDALGTANRVSIRAVLVADGDDVNQALAAAGIIDAVAIPVILGDNPDPEGGILGDGITPNLTGVLEPDDIDATAIMADDADSRSHTDATSRLPASGGMQPFAPVRRR